MFRSFNKRIICLSVFFFVNIIILFVFVDWKETDVSNHTKDVLQVQHKQPSLIDAHIPNTKKREEKKRHKLKLNKSFKEKKREARHRDMMKLHRKVYYYTTDQEVSDFFKEIKVSNALFQKALNIKQHKDILKQLFKSDNTFHNRLIDQLNVKFNTNSTKTILMWSGMDVDWASDIEEKNCNIHNCIFTSNSELNQSDAIIFTDLISSRNLGKLPDSKVKVFYRIESPINSDFITDNSAFHVNWSATYRRDSIIPTPYEYFTPFLNKSKLPSKPIRDFSEGKFKLVAWFASNCYTHNGRINYVLKLQEHIEIDIYGTCGQFHCERGRVECDNILKNEYKFYLAFENGNCKDYVTEKLFWNALRNDVVPIVMGAHPDEYKRIAPPRSFIHVDMFKSPKELAEYLIFLHENDNLYNSYFLWKDTGVFIDTKFACRLCAMVNLAPYFPVWYRNANKWWQNGCDRFLNIDGYSSWQEKEATLQNSNDTIMVESI